MGLRGSLRRKLASAKKVREARGARSREEKKLYQTAYETERKKGLSEAGKMRARAELKAGKLSPKSGRLVRGLRTVGEGMVRASIDAERREPSRRRTRFFDEPPTRRARPAPFSDDWAAEELYGTRKRTPTKRPRKKSKKRTIVIKI